MVIVWSCKPRRVSIVSQVVRGSDLPVLRDAASGERHRLVEDHEPDVPNVGEVVPSRGVVIVVDRVTG